MSYSVIDPIIKRWVADNQLFLLKEAKECEVRTVDVVNSLGMRCQIWIDRPDASGLIGVHVWDYNRHGKRRGKRRDFLIPAHDLKEHLQHALSIATDWNKSR